jgi:hypothetical protein
MNEAQAAKWSKTRTMGKAKYVMYYGVALWGITLTVLTSGIQWVTEQTLDGSWLTIRLAVFGIVGFFVANFRWDGKEKQWNSRSRKK